MTARQKQKQEKLTGHDSEGNVYDVVFMDLDDLKPYGNNPRNNEAAIEPLCQSIKDFGFKNPIIVDKDNVIICGHTRYKAAKKLGLAKVPVHVATDLTEDQVKAFRLADNKIGELSTWEQNLLYIEIDALQDKDIDMIQYGFTDLELNALLENEDPVSDGETDPDKEPEVEDEPISKNGAIYQLGRHKLICGDSTDKDTVQKLIGESQMDLWITDPPYNVDYSGKNEMLNRCEKGNRIQTPIENDKMDNGQFQDFLDNAFVISGAALKPGGCFYIFHADLNGIYLRRGVEASGLKLKQVLQWVKNNIVIGRSDYQWLHEPILYGWKDSGPHYFSGDRKQKTVIDLEKHPFQQRPDGKFEFRIGRKVYTIEPDCVVSEEPTTIVEYPKPQVNGEHPTMKPVGLLVYLIRNSSKRGENVFDGFAGSGSTLIAAEQTARNAFCVELDRHYCDVIRKRWAEFVHGENCDWQKLTPEISAIEKTKGVN